MNRWEFFEKRGIPLRTVTYILLLIGVLATLVSTSFAWFSISRTPQVNDMEIYVNAPAGVQIALRWDAPDEDWGENIAYPDLISTNSPLKPVTWSDAERCFKGIRYGSDGRQTNRWRTLTDEQNANTTGSDQYYVFGTYFMRTGTTCQLSLTEARTMSNGEMGAGTYVIGAPQWDELVRRHVNAGQGAEYAVRIGFLVTMIDPSTGAPASESSFLLYEPNADRHIDGSERLLATPSVDGAEELVPEERHIRQTASTWMEAEPVEKDVTVKTLGEFLDDAGLFLLKAEEMARIDMYIWIEGQDSDCYGVPTDSILFANIQFDADYTEQSGLVDIPEA